MKNVIIILITTILFATFVYADESTKVFEYGTPIDIFEIVENSTGQPCTNCNCNLTLYNVNKTFNSSYIMDTKNNGLYNYTLPQLPINLNNEFYPIIIYCNDSTSAGISTTNLIKVTPKMFDFTSLAMIMVAMTFLLAYVAIKLDPSDPTKVTLKWVYLGLSFLMLIADFVFAAIIANYTGIAGLSSFFNIFIKITGIVFILMILGIVYHLAFVKSTLAQTK